MPDQLLTYATPAPAQPPRRPLLSFLFLLLLVPSATVGTLAGLKWGPGTTWGQLTYLACKAILLLLPALWLFCIDRRPPSLSPPRQGGLMPALLLGLLVTAAILAGYFFAGARGWIDPAPLRTLAGRNKLTSPAYYVSFALATTFVNALLEEYVWRWFVVRRWEDVLGPLRARGIVAAFLASACFTLHHVVVLALYFDAPAVILGSSGVFVGGALWSALYIRYRSIWPCYLCHIFGDVAIFIVGARMIFG